MKQLILLHINLSKIEAMKRFVHYVELVLFLRKIQYRFYHKVCILEALFNNNISILTKCGLKKI